MTSRRGVAFFWLAQLLLLPAVVTFCITAVLRFAGPNPLLARIGMTGALVQLPATALALLLAIAAHWGQLLPKSRILTLFAETPIAILMIAMVFLWHNVYRPL